MLDTLEQHPSAAGRIKAAASFITDAQPEWAAPVKRCREAAIPFGEDISGFLNHALLGSVQDDYDSSAENVALMTLHAAKGLEWQCVFIPGCEDGLLPLSLFKNQQSDLKEERRLFYVGLTRSKKYLFLSSAGKRMLFHQTFTLPKSPFLADIEESLKQDIEIDYSPKYRDKSDQLELF
jgi:superfamily I DNA/RNA helicase